MMVMARVMVIAGSSSLSHCLVNMLSKSPAVEACQFAPPRNGSYALLFAEQAINTVVYAPQLQSQHRIIPDLTEAAAVFAECARMGMTKVVVLSSAAIYGATPHNPGLIAETRSPSRRRENPIGHSWAKLEALATAYLGQQTGTQLTILRPAAVLAHGDRHYFSRLFHRRFAITLPLHDPSLQWLSSEDLARAVCGAVEHTNGGIFNVAPDGVMPLRVALRLAGVRRVPILHALQRVPRAWLASLGLASPSEQLEYIRYSWTIANQKIKQELGFVPKWSSPEVLLDFLHGQASERQDSPARCLAFDDFGMDTSYISAWRRRLFTFLHDYYWRIETKGMEHIPRQGRAVLAGTHRGFMPFDGIMILHQVAQKVERYVRFLIHPGLTKTPFPFNWWKLGGVNACQENADYVLQHDELLGYFPEGVQGAFRSYRDVYRLGKFGRDEYVKAALRNRAPIVPFVTVGSAEIFPIMAKIHWPWWQRLSMWPCIPIAPPFPLLPLPLPTKWHTQFLEPLHIEHRYPPETANDAATVRAISQEVRTRMQDVIDNILKHRKSIFFGSIFENEAN
jgi:1-acyl-sn-glycerol-3-phosphate acyltransferase/nucleoside-diphosphate-sugar epimerase